MDQGAKGPSLYQYKYKYNCTVPDFPRDWRSANASAEKEDDIKDGIGWVLLQRLSRVQGLVGCLMTGTARSSSATQDLRTKPRLATLCYQISVIPAGFLSRVCQWTSGLPTSNKFACKEACRSGACCPAFPSPLFLVT